MSMHTIEVVYDPTTRRISLAQNTDKYGGATTDDNSVMISVEGIEPEGNNFKARVDFDVQVRTGNHIYNHPFVLLEEPAQEERSASGAWTAVIPGAVLAATEFTRNKLQFQLILANDDYVINSRNTITLDVTQGINAQSDDMPAVELPDWEIPDGQTPYYEDVHTVELTYDVDTRELAFVNEKSRYGGATIDTNSVAVIITPSYSNGGSIDIGGQTTRGGQTRSGSSQFKARLDFAVPVMTSTGVAVKPFVPLEPMNNALIAIIPQPILMAAKELKKLPLQLVLREGDSIVNSRNTIILEITRAINAMHSVAQVYEPDLMFRNDTWEWFPDYTYSIGSVVTYEGAIYISLVDGNLGNDPTETEGVYWTIPASAAIYLNGQATSLSSDVSIYAPPDSGTAGTILVSQGEGNAPQWQDPLINYAKQVAEERILYTTDDLQITIEHGLGDYPSSVMIFERSGSPGEYRWDRIDVAYEATIDTITIKFAVHPNNGTALKIKALI